VVAANREGDRGHRGEEMNRFVRVLTAPVRAVKQTGRLLSLRKRGVDVLDVLDEGKADWDNDPTPADRRGAIYATQEFWLRALTAVRELVLELPLPETWIRRITMWKNWRTTLAGIGTLLAVAIKVATEGVGAFTSTDAALVTGAIGLVMAKDSNVTGGTIRQ
jgi:hypothetical protein